MPAGVNSPAAFGPSISKAALPAANRLSPSWPERPTCVIFFSRIRFAQLVTDAIVLAVPSEEQPFALTMSPPSAQIRTGHCAMVLLSGNEMPYTPFLVNATESLCSCAMVVGGWMPAAASSLTL